GGAAEQVSVFRGSHEADFGAGKALPRRIENYASDGDVSAECHPGEHQHACGFEGDGANLAHPEVARRFSMHYGSEEASIRIAEGRIEAIGEAFHQNAEEGVRA